MKTIIHGCYHVINRFVMLYVGVTLSLCGFPLVAASSETNGTRGEPLLWQCTLSEQFDPEKVGIYWQNQNNNEMLHYYRNGKEDLEHQSVSFKNRTKIFPDQLRSGNLSLIIDPLMPEDNLKSLKVVFNHAGDIKDKLCQTMVHVAANFKEPNIEINQKKMTATCTTQGGFPEPELAWISTDHEGHERALEPPDVLTLQIHKEEDGTYSIISTANFTGSKTVTCTVYNPTSNKTVGATADLPAGTQRITSPLINIHRAADQLLFYLLSITVTSQLTYLYTPNKLKLLFYDFTFILHGRFLCLMQSLT
uniref:Ig-like domain-containing protein n=1 Tax=Oreochromis aureus TaxID=47969 RepID=A0AAZ1Y2E8_OREAU